MRQLGSFIYRRSVEAMVSGLGLCPIPWRPWNQVTQAPHLSISEEGTGRDPLRERPYRIIATAINAAILTKIPAPGWTRTRKSNLRSFLYHETARPGHGFGTGYRVWHCASKRRLHRRRQRALTRHHHDHLLTRGRPRHFLLLRPPTQSDGDRIPNRFFCHTH
jgi:hypothetical protein